MNAIVFFFSLGVVFLGLEIFVPGVIMGVIGLVAMICGCVVAFGSFGLGAGALACSVALGLAALTLFLEFFWLPRTRVGRRLFLRGAVTAVTQPLPADSLAVVGKVAEALTILAPTGYVSVDGQRYEAFSLDGHVAKGARLLVNAVDRLTLKVSKLPLNS